MKCALRACTILSRLFADYNAVALPRKTKSESILSPWKSWRKTLPELTSVVADLVRFQLYSGMRSTEMLSIRACDIDMSKAIWRYFPRRHKGSWKGKERVVYLGPKCQEILKPYLDRSGGDTSKYLFSPKDALDEHRQKRRSQRKTKPQRNPQSSNKPLKRGPGEKYRRDSYRNAILRACDRLGIEPWFPHQLRHLAGTLAREVEGLDGSQHFLGHSHSKVTEVYSIIRDSKAEAVARKIG